MAMLVGKTGAIAGVEFPLAEFITIGRSPNAQICVPDPAVSRQHAKIYRRGDSYLLEDLGSIAGTRVNQSTISSTQLKTNDEISIGDSRFTFIEQKRLRPRSTPSCGTE